MIDRLIRESGLKMLQTLRARMRGHKSMRCFPTPVLPNPRAVVSARLHHVGFEYARHTSDASNSQYDVYQSSRDESATS